MTEEQQAQIAGVLSVGCPVETAAAMAGVSVDELRRALDRDADLQKRLERAAASVEVTHVKNIKHASQDDKHWRASVWWLEHCAPEKYARRNEKRVNLQQFEEFVDDLIELIRDEVRDLADLDRLIVRISELASVEASENVEPPSDESLEVNDC